MALYDDLARRDRVTAVPYEASHRMGAPASAIAADRLVGTVRVAFLTFLLICWIAGAYAGIVYWSLHGSLLGVIASALIPGIAATSTWSAFTALDRPFDRRR